MHSQQVLQATVKAISIKHDDSAQQFIVITQTTQI